MLTKIREKVQGIIAGFITVLIAVPFALWGINSYFGGVERDYVAKVDGTTIGTQVYRQALEQFRDPANPGLIQNPAFKQLVVERLVDQVLLAREAHKRGYRLSDERLGRLIRGLPYFQREGRFDPQLYEAMLRREGIGVRDYEESRRREYTVAQVMAGLAESAIVTEPDIAAVIRLFRQEREVAYALIPTETFLPKVTIAPQDVERYYQAHPDLFRTTEEVRIAYLRLSTQQLLEDYSVAEEELRRLYEQESARFTTPERRRAAHILIALPPQADETETARALAKAQGLARQLRDGADFAALARQYSQDPDSAARGGDLGDVRRGMLPRELEQAVFALPPGGVSEPVRTQYGFHLVKLTGYVPEKRQPFEIARPELVKLVRSRKGVQRFYELSEQLRNLVYEQPDSLEPAARALGLKLEQSEWFSRAGGRGIAAHPRVVEAAFSTEVLDLRRNSDVIELDADTFVALRILDHRPAELRPLAEVRRNIERRLRQEAARTAARRLGEELLAPLERGVPLAALALQHGLKYHPPRVIMREAGDPDRRIVEAAFRLPRPEGGHPRYGLADLGEQGYALLALRRVIDGDPARADTAVRAQVERLLRQRRGDDYFAYYRARLRAESKVKIYDDRL